MRRRLLLTALLCAQACRCDEPKAAYRAPECDASHPCAGHQLLLEKLPPAVAAAMPKKWVPYLGEVVAVDLNCDGKNDYAVPVLERATPFAEGFETRPAGRALLQWATFAAGSSPLLLALSQPDGSFAFEARGSAPAGLITLSDDIGCDPRGLAAKVDLQWAKAHACGVIGYGETEQEGGSALLFDHRSGKLVEVGNDCE